MQVSGGINIRPASVRFQGDYGRYTPTQPANDWNHAVSQLAPHLQPVVKTFGELVQANSGAFEYKPRYPKAPGGVPRFPFPSNPEQQALAGKLVTMLKELGLQAKLDRHFNVIGVLHGNLPDSFKRKAQLPTIALKAHLDTTYELPNSGVKPRLHRNYNGGEIVIAERNGDGKRVALSPQESPALTRRVGEDIITASGDTLLGADAKAGIAEILEMLRVLREYNAQNPQKPLYHPDLRIVFTVDEETNLLGARCIDLTQLGADFAIDLDDTEPGNINVKSYFGHNININIKARMVHSAEAGAQKSANPMMLASQLMASLPKNQLMENKSAKMQGYLYLDQMQANWHEANMLVLARDFSEAGVKKRVQTVVERAEKMRKALQGTPASLSWQVEEEYRNPKISANSKLYHYLAKSAQTLGIAPKATGFKGCTDAAIWTERGLPTVNLGCGWQNAHQLTEWVSAQDLYKMSRYLLSIITRWPAEGPTREQLPNQGKREFTRVAWPKMTYSPPS